MKPKIKIPTLPTSQTTTAPNACSGGSTEVYIVAERLKERSKACSHLMISRGKGADLRWTSRDAQEFCSSLLFFIPYCFRDVCVFRPEVVRPAALGCLACSTWQWSLAFRSHFVLSQFPKLKKFKLSCFSHF